jgi:CubicO group peptidase (beta-lactamase class C family)
MANYSSMMPFDCNTIFRMGSITKQFTAMCILILEKKGLLSIDECLKNYFPDYKNGCNITIKQLLNMTSGIPEYLIHPEWKGHEVPNNKSLDNYYTYDFIKHLSLDYIPGEKMTYSNPNYILLSIIIEKVSGISYPDFLQKNIFSVLNMTRSGYLPVPIHFDNIAIGYKSINPVPQEADTTIYNMSMGANNIFTSISDLRKWDSALYTEKLISQEKTNEMLSPSSTGSMGNYGYGWFIDKDIVSHGGLTIGFNAMISRNIKTKQLIIMLSNVEGNKDSYIYNYYELIKEFIE